MRGGVIYQFETLPLESIPPSNSQYYTLDNDLSCNSNIKMLAFENILNYT